LAIPAFIAISAVVAMEYRVSPWSALAYVVLSAVSLMVYASTNQQ
jgi:hypothetical protein